MVDEFGALLDKMQGADVFYVFRNLLRLLVTTEYSVFLTSSVAVIAFKMY